MRVDESYIRSFIGQQDYDVRKSHNARFTDQKCIPDVVCAVAECIIEYISDDVDKAFTKNDVWHSDYANSLLTECFTKPDTENETMSSEYDKFFAQPMKMLAAAGVLNERQVNRANTYHVNEYNILQYISLREKNALTFLDIYLTKVMTDSGCMAYFDRFFTQQDKHSLEELKDKLLSLLKNYTPIRGDFEPPRIYNKIH